MKRIAWLVWMVSGLAIAQTQLTGQVISVHDGDTLHLLDQQFIQHTIRLAGIDAPEINQEFDQQAKQALMDMVIGERVTATCVGKSYERPVCAIRKGAVEVNLHMVQQGMAWVDPRYAIDPRLFEAHDHAQAARRGLWADSSPIPPWEFRRQAVKKHHKTVHQH